MIRRKSNKKRQIRAKKKRNFLKVIYSKSIFWRRVNKHPSEKKKNLKNTFQTMAYLILSAFIDFDFSIDEESEIVSRFKS